ncbi:deoxyribonuclease-1-like [Pseudophryne corroboree]|uniref:deoxyribonuclease-1-like n=1 Tax=Pseudophryne corroboree TaxID=495146 RepID=UPI003081B4CD
MTRVLLHFLSHSEPHGASQRQQRRKRMKVASFNARRFGIKKCTDAEVFPIITKIASRYDIIVLLEVFDAKEKAAKLLVEKLNNTCEDGASYKYVISKPLGRKEYKEQYLFVYRADLVAVMEQYQYEDMQHGDEDSFAREPFIIRFESKKLAVKDFVLIPVHTTPKDSVQEIDELYDVYLHVKEKWGTENIILLGDFNADGAYVSNKRMKTIRLRTDPCFHWLICDDTDTTATNTTDCSYDRIVVHEALMKYIVPNSAKPFNFQQEYKLTDDEALAVSDHYPVEVELSRSKGKAAKKK